MAEPVKWNPKCNCFRGMDEDGKASKRKEVLHMQFTGLHIRNFKFIRDMKIQDIGNALILVGKNNTGKTTILDAIRAVCGSYVVTDEDFNEKKQNIEIEVSVKITEDDRQMLHRSGIVSQYKRYDIWDKDFRSKLPSYDGEIMTFLFTVNREGQTRYGDGVKKHNRYIQEVMPKIYYIDVQRDLEQIQEDLLMCQEDELLTQMRSGCCLFDQAKQCNHCFQCIGLINQKSPDELNAYETSKLLEYKLYQLNLSEFSEKVNRIFHRNGGFMEEIHYTMECDVDRLFKVNARTYSKERGTTSPIENLGKGMKSIYMLSLLEAYVEGENHLSSIILVEDPEIFLHPQLQKVASEILYRLSKKNQVIFTTHSPNMLFNFNSRQIRQIVLDGEYFSIVREPTDIGNILDDLGYSANDLLDVSFVFIVEGKQDKSRLPLLLEKYYSEVYDEHGKLSRIAIITTNSCTNIKTYANLKYMNRIYLRDQFLMIRDGDGMDPVKLSGQLCKYYDQRNLEDVDQLPKVTQRNVLILKYYSFENYFLNPVIMAQLGIIESVESFYEILFTKWKEYLHRLRSGRNLTEVLGRDLESIQDIQDHIEDFKIYMRGHNLYDIFYGRYRSQETELLRKYIDLAPRDDFADILDSIDQFVYFDSRKKEINPE